MGNVVVAGLLTLTGIILGFIYGYHVGVKETEVRWTEAVARADDARLRKASHDPRP